MAPTANPKARRADIVLARRRGETFRLIGESRGISRGRAAVLYKQGLKDEEDAPPPGPVTLATAGGDLPVSRRARAVIAPLGLSLGEMLAMPLSELSVLILREPNGNRRVPNEVIAYLERRPSC